MTQPNRKQRPNYERDPTGLPRIRLQERDLELIELAYEYRTPDSDMLVAAYRLRHPDKASKGKKLGRYTTPQAGEKAIKRRLRLLYHWGFLSRPAENLVLRARRRRSLPFVYRIGPAAVPLLTERGHDPEKLRGALKDPNFRYLEHSLMVSEFRLALERALAEHPGYTLLFWLNEGADTRTAWHSSRGGRRTRHTVNPDAYFAITDGTRPMYFFIDIDRGTMSRRRMRAKLEALSQLWKEGRHHRPPYEMPAKTPFRALFPTVSLERAETLRAIAREADPKGRGLNLFWVTHTDVYRGDYRGILSPIWKLPTGEEPYSLLERKVK